METKSIYYKSLRYFTLIAICFNMAACKNLTQETAPEGAKTITSKSQPIFSAPACTRDHAHVKPLDDQNMSCASCHTKCVNIMHCKKFVDTWNTNNCQSCHKADPYKKESGMNMRQLLGFDCCSRIPNI